MIYLATMVLQKMADVGTRLEREYITACHPFWGMARNSAGIITVHLVPA